MGSYLKSPIACRSGGCVETRYRDSILVHSSDRCWLAKGVANDRTAQNGQGKICQRGGERGEL